MKKDETMDRLLERTSRQRAGAHAADACLDAETLAALIDGSLAPAERYAAEAHAADCDRCLATLAAIAQTSPPALAAARPSWFSVRWLVPLTTVAAAMTVWIAFQQPSPPPASVPETTLADAAKPDRPPSPDNRVATQSRDAKLEKKLESAAPVQQKERDLSRRNTGVAAKRSEVAVDTLESRKSATGAPVTDRRTAAAPPPPAAASPTNAPSRADMSNERTMQQFGAAVAPVTVLSPEPSVRWRLIGRTVERSTDGGATWQAHATGTSVDLLAGAAPSAAVCWIAGRSGVVLLTTDGLNWRRLDFPDPTIDLVGVSARDGLDATVTAANGRRYRTTDAGRTWTLQENPLAPF